MDIAKVCDVCRKALAVYTKTVQEPNPDGSVPIELKYYLCDTCHQELDTEEAFRPTLL